MTRLEGGYSWLFVRKVLVHTPARSLTMAKSHVGPGNGATNSGSAGVVQQPHSPLRPESFTKAAQGCPSDSEERSGPQVGGESEITPAIKKHTEVVWETDPGQIQRFACGRCFRYARTCL
jgi:hypothetical protein